MELSGVDSTEGKGGRQAGAWRACARSSCPPSSPPGKEEDDWLGQLGRARPHSAGPAQELAAGKIQKYGIDHTVEGIKCSSSSRAPRSMRGKRKRERESEKISLALEPTLSYERMILVPLDDMTILYNQLL